MNPRNMKIHVKEKMIDHNFYPRLFFFISQAPKRKGKVKELKEV